MKHLDTEGAEGREKESNLKYVYPSYFMLDKQTKHEDDKSCHKALQTSFKTRNSDFLHIYKTLPCTYLTQLLFLEEFELQLPTLIVEALLCL